MQETLFTTVKLEDFVPADHPLRAIRLLVNDALKDLNGLFGTIYADSGRASMRAHCACSTACLAIMPRRSVRTRLTTRTTLFRTAERAG